MRIETRLGEGTTVKVFLPRATKSDGTDSHADSASPTKLHRRSAIILLVDDDNAVREVTAAILRDLGYVVLEVGSGGAALDVLDGEAQVELVLLDFAMPGMNGMDVARQVQSKHPTLPVLFITGYADKTALENVGDAQIIKKPFVGDELAHKVSAALSHVRSRPRGKVVPLRR